ncbi:FmdB family zinc ribbon protein [Microbacterium foliorum]|jgi:putative FmdB family regulatory protein|uniref:FmdB family transcriptional regulator n=1 Tax=Microbacterium foliorum TaxID=104336 RepID=A0A4Y5YT09_9MICO|nr:FmdB family zinc ribbon protein [Microbacterium foliorum]QDE35479.1 FmdB family transcriptional regulator [Microbacterium foliorum]
MPTYAYACRSCGHAFDAVQSFSDDALTVCPECGGELRKQYGSIGVTFNGSGFYRTDSRAGSGASAPAPASSKSEPAKSTTPAPASTSTSS